MVLHGSNWLYMVLNRVWGERFITSASAGYFTSASVVFITSASAGYFTSELCRTRDFPAIVVLLDAYEVGSKLPAITDGEDVFVTETLAYFNHPPPTHACCVSKDLVANLALLLTPAIRCVRDSVERLKLG